MWDNGSSLLILLFITGGIPKGCLLCVLFLLAWYHFCWRWRMSWKVKIKVQQSCSKSWVEIRNYPSSWWRGVLPWIQWRWFSELRECRDNNGRPCRWFKNKLLGVLIPQISWKSEPNLTLITMKGDAVNKNCASSDQADDVCLLWWRGNSNKETMR